MSTTSEFESDALRLELFGQLALTVHGHVVPALSRSARSLLSLLALRSPRSLERDLLASTLWPDSDDAAARYNLRRTLTELRAALGAEVARLETPAPQKLRFDMSGDAFCDVAAFDAAVAAAARGGANIAALERAVQLYAARGALLVSERADWMVPERAVRAGNYLAARESLAAFCRERGELENAIRHHRAVLAVDSMRETAVRGLMRALNESGQNAAALVEYQNLSELLRANADAAPDAATTHLYNELRAPGQKQASDIDTDNRAAATMAALHSAGAQRELGLPKPIEFPTGAVTFLFTDIEGSTRNWEAHPDRMSAALSRHDALVRDAIESAQGVVFKTIGDGFYAVFALPANALTAAVQAQRVLRNELWPDDVPIAVRMALHTGVPELRNGDYFGNPLNRAARLLATAHGGQVLVSAATHELIRDYLPAEIGLYNLGHQNLKDLDRPEDVFAATHPDLADPASFPSVRIAKTPTSPNNLPRPTTSFVGRELQMHEVRELLAKTRLLTLVGTGGAGKTRLALQVASGVLDMYPDGVWFVELAPISDGALVTQTIAQVFGVKEQPGQSISHALAEFLKSKQVLILLDNCEHVVEACARLAIALLNECPGLTLLATSREPLAVSGEQSYRVPPLSLSDPNTAHQTSVRELSEYESVRLFIERALLVNLDFGITEATAPALAQLCYRLDGIPLALELAAARIRSLSLDEINARLDDRFRLLSSNNRSVLPRQQTLRALVDWSYDLLSEPEKLLFERLSVFVGGWTLEAAESVCGFEPLEDWEVLDLLMGLVDKSLVLAETGDGGSRYRMLETIRQYAVQKLGLGGGGAATTMRDRHRDWCLALADEAEPHMLRLTSKEWKSRLESEHDNLRAALSWCAANGSPDDEAGNRAMLTGLNLSSALTQFWLARGYRSEGRESLERALKGWRRRSTKGDANHETALSETELTAFEDAPGEWPIAVTRALSSASILANAQADSGAALSLLDMSLSISRKIGHKNGIASALANMGTTSHNRGDFAEARRLHEDSLELYRELGMEWNVASAYNNLGTAAQAQGDYAAARVFHEQSLSIRRVLGDQNVIANSLNNLGVVAYRQGDYATAKAQYRESLAIHRAEGSKHGVANALNNLGLIASSEGNYAEAQRLLEESLTLKREINDRKGIASGLDNLAGVILYQGDLAKAESLFEEGLDLIRELADKSGIAMSLSNLGETAAMRGDHVTAKSRFMESLAICGETGDKAGIALLLMNLGNVAIAEGDPRSARKLFVKSLDLYHGMARKEGIAHCLDRIAVVTWTDGYKNMAVHLWAAEDALRTQVGFSLPPKEQAEYVAYLAAARAQLGDAEFAAAWDMGRAMGLERAVEVARSEPVVEAERGRR